eukprot:gene7323-11692_t
MRAVLQILLGLVAAASAAKPHIFHVIVDDLGWGNTGYHRNANDSTPEIQTPNMDGLVNDGIKLMRHYVHAMCTPTRSDVNDALSIGSPMDVACGIPYNATTISQKMKQGGWAAHFIGKWDCGAATPKHTPYGRNYSTALTYFGHGNYQWGELEWNGNNRDLWFNNVPAVAIANASRDRGIYESEIFTEKLLEVINNHDPESTSLFLTYAARIAHYPIQAPIAYQKLPHIAAIDVPHRMVYHAQIQFLDDQIGLGPCTDGGPTSVWGVECTSGEAGANNHPLRGGKYSFLEGGIRANSFASGGMLPPAVRGTVSFALMHVADWYATYATMAGVDPNDAAGEAAGVPAIDGFNVLPLLLGDNATSPRTEIFFTKDCLMKGDWKLLRSKTSSASWPGPTYPNASTAADNNTLNNYNLDCSGNAPCLFNVAAD